MKRGAEIKCAPNMTDKEMRKMRKRKPLIIQVELWEAVHAQGGETVPQYMHAGFNFFRVQLRKVHVVIQLRRDGGAVEIDQPISPRDSGDSAVQT